MSDDRLPQLSLEDFLRRLSTRDPVPGGGTASALAGATGAALVHMVVELTAGRGSNEADEARLTEIRGAAATWQSELLNLAELDANAYDAVVRARRLPRETEREAESRRVQIHAAVQHATRVPLEVVRGAGEVLGLAARLAPIGNRHAISDVGVAGLLAVAAMRGAAMNVRINLPSLPDDDQLREEAPLRLAEALDALDDRDRALRDAVAERLA
jgi:formiminotetrahydrofolate cyclodeaminase